MPWRERKARREGGIVGLPAFTLGGQGRPGSKGEQEVRTCRGAERAMPKSGQTASQSERALTKALRWGGYALHILRV